MAAFSHDAHSTHTTQGSWSTRRIATTALFCALAFILTFVEIPIFPPAPWLTYDPSGIIALIAGLIFGPTTGAIVVVLPWVLKTLFSFNIYGHLMAVLAGLALTLPASLIARRLTGTRGLVIGLIVGGIISLVACIVGNLFITPLYTAISLQAVIEMIIPILLPFNLIKVLLNCVVTALIQKPISQVVSA